MTEVKETKVETTTKKAVKKATKEVITPNPVQEKPSLSLVELTKQHKKLQTKTTHTIDVQGEAFVVEVDDTFTKSKQGELLQDLTVFLNEGNLRFELLDYIYPYTTLLLLKHFTSLDIPDNVDEALTYLALLTDLEILADLLLLLPDNEVTSTFTLLEQAIESMTKTFEEAEKESERLSETLDNEFLREKLKEKRMVQ